MPPGAMEERLHLTHQELKEFLRRRFARAGLQPPIFDAIAEIALLIRRFGFARFLEGLDGDRGPGTYTAPRASR